MKDQTLDQQCTVTRPGVAAIASALLVELLASVLQHPRKHHAPAPSPIPGPAVAYDRDPLDHALGIVPHQIRGFLSEFRNMVVHGKSYEHCSACSTAIVYAYKNDGWEFVKTALNNRDYVTELSGLAEVQRRADAAAADVDWSDDEGAAVDDYGDGELV
jgi:ubiquitin-like modifier-activating enzyme ATG7